MNIKKKSKPKKDRNPENRARANYDPDRKTAPSVLSLSSRRYNPVKTKTDFVKRYKRGEFGNRSPTWDNLEQFREYFSICWPSPERKFHLRSKTGGGRTYYNLSFDHAFMKNCEFPDHYVSEMAPTLKTIIQGEVRQTENGWEFLHTSVKKPMRDALKEESIVHKGLFAKQLLEYHLCDRSFEWLTILFERYPDHIIEISTYSENWGTIPGFNTVFWEVRADRKFGTQTSPFTRAY